MTVHYAPYGKNAVGEFQCGARDGGCTGRPGDVTCNGCKAASPGLWVPTKCVRCQKVIAYDGPSPGLIFCTDGCVLDYAMKLPILSVFEGGVR